MDFSKVVSAIKPAVVVIGVRATSHDTPFRHYVDTMQPSMLPELLGTGFCIHQKGIIVTCQQVVETLSDIIHRKRLPTASAIAMFLSHDRSGRAYFDGIPCDRVLSPGAGIGLIELRPHSSPLPTIAGGENYRVEVGEEIGICAYLIGEYPLPVGDLLAGGTSFVQKGIISAIVPGSSAADAGELVISAPVGSGFAGAPVFRADKPELLGVIRAVGSPTITAAGQELHLPVQHTAFATPGHIMTKAIDVGIQALLK
jgi:hypothetical protein